MAISWTEPLVVKIGGTDRTSSIARDSVSVEQTASTRGTPLTTASFKVLDGSAFSLAELDTVSIENDDASTIHFKGRITSLSESQIKSTQLNYDVSCTNYVWQMEHVEELWDHEHTDETDSDIITEALNTTCPDICTTVYVEETDDDISENFDKVAGREVLDRLAQRCGAVWYVDNGPVDSADIATELPGGGFETPGAGGADIWANWTEVAGDGALANETTLVKVGSDACKMTAGASADTEVYQDITVQENWDYDLVFWTRGDGTYGGRYRIYDNTNAANIVTSTATGVTAEVYAEVTKAFTVPTGCTSIRVYFRCPTTDTGVCYFDGATLKRVYQVHLHYFISPLSDAAELLTNGGFETAGGGGADIWGTWSETASDGALANETSLVYAGDDAAKITAGASVDTQIQQTITVVAGMDYTLQFYQRGDGTYGGRYSIRDVSNGAWIQTIVGTAVAASYAKFENDWTAPDGCTSVRVSLVCPHTDGGVCYFDAVSVKRNYDAEWQLLGDTYAASGSYYTNLTKQIAPPEANRVRVLGAGSVDEIRTTGSRADYGQWITTIVRNKDCKDALQAQTFGDNYLAYKKPDPTYSCQTYRHGLFAGQVVELTNSIRSLTSEVLDIKRVTTQWHGVHDGGSNWTTTVALELGKFRADLTDKLAEMARAAKKVPELEWDMDHLDFTGALATTTLTHSFSGALASTNLQHAALTGSTGSAGGHGHYITGNTDTVGNSCLQTDAANGASYEDTHYHIVHATEAHYHAVDGGDPTYATAVAAHAHTAGTIAVPDHVATCITGIGTLAVANHSPAVVTGIGTLAIAVVES